MVSKILHLCHRSIGGLNFAGLSAAPGYSTGQMGLWVEVLHPAGKLQGSSRGPVMSFMWANTCPEGFHDHRREGDGLVMKQAFVFY